MFIAATNKSVDVIAGKLSLGTYIAENYKNLLSQQPLWSSFFNSCKYTLLVTAFALVVSSLAGYAFEIYKDKAKEKIYLVILMSMMIPFVALMVPLFRMYSKLGLLNSAVGFMLPSLATPLLIMMFRTNAKAFPIDIIEAARIDGLSEIGIFFSDNNAKAHPSRTSVSIETSCVLVVCTSVTASNRHVKTFEIEE